MWALVYLVGVSAPIYVISVPSIDQNLVATYICQDFVNEVEYSDQDGYPCSISTPAEYFCDPSDPSTYYTGYLPTTMQFKVRSVPFDSLVLFKGIFVSSALVSNAYSDFPVSF